MSSTAVGEVQDDKPHPAYETNKVLNEYLLFHYGHEDDLLAFPFGPKEALHFPRVTGELCLQAAKEHNIASTKRCLDLGIPATPPSNTRSLIQTNKDALWGGAASN